MGFDDSGEEVLRAIRDRHSIGKVLPEIPPRELVERVLSAAVCAPNHYRTQPWEFVVVTGAARNRLGDVMAKSLHSRLPDADGDEARQLIERERRKPLRAPVVIAVAVRPSENVKSVEIEEIAAVSACIQNMLLAAHALGLGAMWRTGQPARDPRVKCFLGLRADSHLLAFVYLGYPDLPGVPHPDRDWESRTTWMTGGDVSDGWPDRVS